MSKKTKKLQEANKLLLEKLAIIISELPPEQHTKEIGNLSGIVAEKDGRTLAAFGAIESPAGGKNFDYKIVAGLMSLDFKALLKIAFENKLNAQQSEEFLDLTEYMCNKSERADVINFIKKEFKNVENLIHPESKDRFISLLSKKQIGINIFKIIADKIKNR